MNGRKSKRLHKFGSILIISTIVVSGIVIIPISSPKVKAAYPHLRSAKEEDGNPTYDADGVANKVVVWFDPGGSGGDHHLLKNYVVDANYTLEIPALDFTCDPENESVIYFASTVGGSKIDVYGTLITHAGGPNTKTAFLGEHGAWQGIYFYNGSKAVVQNCQFRESAKGCVFYPGSTLLADFQNNVFDEMQGQGLSLNDVKGAYNYTNNSFWDYKYDKSCSIDVSNMSLTIKNSYFSSHGDNLSQLHIKDANVYLQNVHFIGMDQPGNLIHIEGDCNDTIISRSFFNKGKVGYHYIRVDGACPLIDNCSFEFKEISSSKVLSVIAKDDENGIPAEPIIRQPTGNNIPGFWDSSFDNSTLEANGSSRITLQWYLRVYVRDPDYNPIDNAPVWVEDSLGTYGHPHSIITDSGGWAGNFLVTEFILYNDSIENFNRFIVSTINNSITAYADTTINMSKEVEVEVPFSPYPNISPILSYISTPNGIQSNMILFDFIIQDPTPGDDGNLSIMVKFSDDGITWSPATAGLGSNLEHLDNNTLYQFFWNSANPQDFQGIFSKTVYIKITPIDRGGVGTSGQTGNFTVDNEPPKILSGPIVTATDTTAFIEWTVHEPADACALYGLSPIITTTVYNNSSSTFQSITLFNLTQGRLYNYILTSTDKYGNIFSSNISIFKTKIYIQLFKGWNMISCVPYSHNLSLEYQLSSIEGKYAAVQIFDSSDVSDPWKDYIPDKNFGNALHEISSNYGIWIKMRKDTKLTVNHDIPRPDTPPYEINLKKGWNFIGYPSVTIREVKDALTNVPYKIIQTYDAKNKQWESYDPDTGLGTLTYMELSKGYMIYVTEDFLWKVNYV